MSNLSPDLLNINSANTLTNMSSSYTTAFPSIPSMPSIASVAHFTGQHSIVPGPQLAGTGTITGYPSSVNAPSNIYNSLGPYIPTSITNTTFTPNTESMDNIIKTRLTPIINQYIIKFGLDKLEDLLKTLLNEEQLRAERPELQVLYKEYICMLKLAK